MDEPTNHLDIWSCEALERSINEFEGTVLVVSHDRYFLNQVADRLIVVADGRARVIEGDYETYQHLVQTEKERADKSQAQAAAVAPAGRGRRTGDAAPAGAPRTKRKFPYRKAADIEREIGELEGEVAELEDLLGQPATWRDPVKAVGTQDRHRELKTQAGNALRALGDRARSKLVKRRDRSCPNIDSDAKQPPRRSSPTSKTHARPTQSPRHHPPRDRALARDAGPLGRHHRAR